MGVSRRALLFGLAASAATPSFAGFPHIVPDNLVVFVGNSFMRQHDVPGQVCALAQQSRASMFCHRRTANGAKLFESISFAEGLAAERGSRLPATVVLQDHSLEPLKPETRQRSAKAMAIYAAQFEHTVLQETWPRRAGHRLYDRAGMPNSPEAMTRLVREHYAEQAARTGASVAPVALAWQRAIALGYDLHARDGYHANETGAQLTALVLGHALGIPLPKDEPLAEIAATTAT